MDRSPSEEQKHLLGAFADGGAKSYVHICRHLRVPLTPLAPTETKKLCKPLLQAGLIERAGLLKDKYRITARGQSALAGSSAAPTAEPPPLPTDEEAPPRPFVAPGNPTATFAQPDTNPTGAPPSASPADPSASARPVADGLAPQNEKAPARSEPIEEATPAPGAKVLPIVALWVVGLVLLPILEYACGSLSESFRIDPPLVLTLLAWGPVVFTVIVGTTRVARGQALDLGNVALRSFLTMPAALVGMVLMAGLGRGFASDGATDGMLALGLLFGIALVTIVFCARVATSAPRGWLEEVGGPRLGEPDVPREKSVGFAYLLLAMTGIFGGHRYYLERYITGALYTCTFGVLLVGLFVDFFLTPRLVRKTNQRIWMRWFERPGAEWVKVEGTARDVSGGQFESREAKSGPVRRMSLSFRIEELDESGDIVRYIPVEVVGISFTGNVRDGDTVRLTGRRSAENIVRTLAVDNISTGSKVIASFL